MKKLDLVNGIAKELGVPQWIVNEVYEKIVSRVEDWVNSEWGFKLPKIGKFTKSEYEKECVHPQTWKAIGKRKCVRIKFLPSKFIK
jgi:nucleoid DNA-binding protein